jgi:transcriptional regulator with XRE-family HTH domain
MDESERSAMKKIEQILQLRKKKLGLLLMDARLAARRTQAECADLLSVSVETMQAFENGQESPGLPELETLAYFLNVPMSHFWGNKSLSEGSTLKFSEKIHQFIVLRNQAIAAVLQQKRQESSQTLAQLSEDLAIPLEKLEKFELGEETLPLAELEILAAALNLNLEDLFDRESEIGAFRIQQAAFERFLLLSEEMRDFVSKPVNEPYIQVAQRLSQTPVEKLRSIAESLLEITF